MPASKQVYYHGEYKNVRIHIEPVHEPESVYFTDEAPKFELVISNQTKNRITSCGGKGIHWTLALGRGVPDPYRSGYVDVDVKPNSEQRIKIGGELLAFEGNACIGINGAVNYRDEENNDRLIINIPDVRNVNNFRALYTFTIWDRSHYQEVHERPKQLQKQVVRLSILVALLAAIQIAVGLFQIGVL